MALFLKPPVHVVDRSHCHGEILPSRELGNNTYLLFHWPIHRHNESLLPRTNCLPKLSSTRLSPCGGLRTAPFRPLERPCSATASLGLLNTAKDPAFFFSICVFPNLAPDTSSPVYTGIRRSTNAVLGNLLAAASSTDTFLSSWLSPGVATRRLVRSTADVELLASFSFPINVKLMSRRPSVPSTCSVGMLAFHTV
jgi:hypothetical protein